MEESETEHKLGQIAAASTRLLQDSQGDSTHYEDLLIFSSDHDPQVGAHHLPEIYVTTKLRYCRVHHR